MEKNYLSKGIDITLEDTEIKKFLANLKGAEYKDTNINLSFAYGYEKGCLMKDAENVENIKIINKINTDKVLDSLESIKPLVQYLKNNDDIYIKCKILNVITKLNSYFTEVLSKNENESESV